MSERPREPTPREPSGERAPGEARTLLARPPRAESTPGDPAAYPLGSQAPGDRVRAERSRGGDAATELGAGALGDRRTAGAPVARSGWTTAGVAAVAAVAGIAVAVIAVRLARPRAAAGSHGSIAAPTARGDGAALAPPGADRAEAPGAAAGAAAPLSAGAAAVEPTAGAASGSGSPSAGAAATEPGPRSPSGGAAAAVPAEPAAAAGPARSASSGGRAPAGGRPPARPAARLAGRAAEGSPAAAGGEAASGGGLAAPAAGGALVWTLARAADSGGGHFGQLPPKAEAFPGHPQHLAIVQATLAHVGYEGFDPAATAAAVDELIGMDQVIAKVKLAMVERRAGRCAAAAPLWNEARQVIPVANHVASPWGARAAMGMAACALGAGRVDEGYAHAMAAWAAGPPGEVAVLTAVAFYERGEAPAAQVMFQRARASGSAPARAAVAAWLAATGLVLPPDP